jgi:hypothetical protein
MKADVWEIVGAIFVLAIIYLLVRPQSLGPSVIEGMGSALANVITFAVSS